jgi:hypothetical protein
VNSLIRLPTGLFEELLAHLLPDGCKVEQAAFLFVAADSSAEHVRFDVVEVAKLAAADFDSQGSEYLELADNTRARLIKHAHDLGVSLVEMHSHPFPWPAAFSDADLAGLAETVPDMWWRLPKRPYIAVVVAPSGFDALLWLDSPSAPQALGGVLAGDRLMRPTNRTLRALPGGLTRQ